MISLVLSTAAQSREPLIVAHRGASYDAPENTLAAFRLAWEQHADAIEADFHLTADGHVVCLHDKDTQRVAGVQHVVAETPLATLRTLDVGSFKGAAFRGERIPTLQEVLAIVPRGKMVFIELKVGGPIVPPVMDALASSGLRDEQIVIISFDADAIAECERRRPAVRTQWLTRYERQDDGGWRPGADAILAMMRRSGADAFGSMANREALHEPLMQKLREGGVREFGVWTVDDPELARFYTRLGAWSITTNRPAWLREQAGLLTRK
ncbi:MAG TPA: glycerophosphodiester phosphodiesterase [Lacipirellulaceae bacterium]|nr:glycerophosphodiester phosphodiesterase [Lacipirellulaceae bacterium]